MFCPAIELKDLLGIPSRYKLVCYIKKSKEDNPNKSHKFWLVLDTGEHGIIQQYHRKDGWFWFLIGEIHLPREQLWKKLDPRLYDKFIIYGDALLAGIK